MAGKKWGGDKKTLKNCIVQYVEQNLDYGCQIYNTASAGRLKKLNSIHREDIRIYKRAFWTSPVESLHLEAKDLLLELRRSELGLRFLYKLISNPHI